MNIEGKMKQNNRTWLKQKKGLDFLEYLGTFLHLNHSNSVTIVCKFGSFRNIWDGVANPTPEVILVL